MKRFFGMLCIVMLAFSCKENPLKDLESGEWNKEKQLISLSLAGQVGDATISISSEHTSLGYADVVIITPDYSQPITISAMEISYGATANVAAGEALSFNASGEAEIIITAVDGQTRTYTVQSTELDEELVGTWNITSLYCWGGAAQCWGCSALMDITWGDWDATTGAAADLDNTLTFTLEGLNDAGETYGTCVYSAGGDGLYGDYIWPNEVSTYAAGLDCNDFYSKIPKGESTWTRNTSTGTVSFTQNGVTVTAGYLAAGTYDIVGDSDWDGIGDSGGDQYSFDIDNNVLKFSGFSWTYGWDDNVLWTTFGRMALWPYEYYVHIEKQ